jgi:hypothetical protein
VLNEESPIKKCSMRCELYGKVYYEKWPVRSDQFYNDFIEIIDKKSLYLV